MDIAKLHTCIGGANADEQNGNVVKKVKIDSPDNEPNDDENQNPAITTKRSSELAANVLGEAEPAPHTVNQAFIDAAPVTQLQPVGADGEPVFENTEPLMVSINSEGNAVVDGMEIRQNVQRVLAEPDKEDQVLIDPYAIPSKPKVTDTRNSGIRITSPPARSKPIDSNRFKFIGGLFILFSSYLLLSRIKDAKIETFEQKLETLAASNQAFLVDLANSAKKEIDIIKAAPASELGRTDSLDLHGIGEGQGIEIENSFDVLTGNINLINTPSTRGQTWQFRGDALPGKRFLIDYPQNEQPTGEIRIIFQLDNIINEPCECSQGSCFKCMDKYSDEKTSTQVHIKYALIEGNLGKDGQIKAARYRLLYGYGNMAVAGPNNLAGFNSKGGQFKALDETTLNSLSALNATWITRKNSLPKPSEFPKIPANKVPASPLSKEEIFKQQRIALEMHSHNVGQKHVDCEQAQDMATRIYCKNEAKAAADTEWKTNGNVLVIAGDRYKCTDTPEICKDEIQRRAKEALDRK